jgi:hypothetical protein
MLFIKSDQDYVNYINLKSDKWAVKNPYGIGADCTSKKILNFKARVESFKFSEHFRNCTFNHKSEALIGSNDLKNLIGLQEPFIFIVNNSDYARNIKIFNELLEKENIIFVAWDWDNNHWLNNSIDMAKKFDIYIPSSLVNGYCLANFAKNYLSPVELGSGQWKREFLLENRSLILQSKRSVDDISGGFTFYPEFPLRNETITLLNKYYARIKFTKNFHSNSDNERLQSYLQSVAQLVVPIYDGFPNRFFDVLLTGGIPVVPPLLKFRADLQGMDRCVLFDGWNKSSIDEAIFKACQVYKNQMPTAVFLEEMIELHHIDNRKNKIVDQIIKFIG